MVRTRYKTTVLGMGTEPLSLLREELHCSGERSQTAQHHVSKGMHFFDVHCKSRAMKSVNQSITVVIDV